MSPDYTAFFARVDEWTERREYNKLACDYKRLSEITTFLEDDEVPNMSEVKASRDPLHVPMEVRERFEKYRRLALKRVWEMAFGYYFGVYSTKEEARRRAQELFTVSITVQNARLWVRFIDRRQLGKDGTYYTKRESFKYSRSLRKAFGKEPNDDTVDMYASLVGIWRNTEAKKVFNDDYLKVLAGGIQHAHYRFFVDGHLEENSFYAFLMGELVTFGQLPTRDFNDTLEVLRNLPYFVCKMAAASKIETEYEEWNVQGEDFFETDANTANTTAIKSP